MEIDPLSTTLYALADPTRRAILERLAYGDATVTELARPFDMSMAGVSKHLKVLEAALLVSRSRRSQWRPCHLEAAPLRDATAWLATVDSGNAAVDALAEHLDRVQKHRRFR